MKLSATLVATIAIACLLAGPAAGDVVVDYDVDNDNDVGSGNFTDANNDTTLDLFDGDGADDVEAWLANDTNVNDALPAPGGYNGPAYQGAVRVQGRDKTSISFDNEDATTFSLRLQGDGERIHGVVYFNSTVGPVALTETSYMAFDEDGLEDSEEITRFEALENARWLLRDVNGNFYLSDTAIGNNNDGATLTGDELFGLNAESQTMWAAADPASEINLDLASLSYSLTASDFGFTLEGFGFYIEEDGIEGDDRVWFGFNGFTVDAQPIPEPATAGLLGLGVLALLHRRRRA